MGADEEALDLWIDPETLPTEVATLSEADEVAELVANDGVAAAQNSKVNEARNFLKCGMGAPDSFL